MHFVASDGMPEPYFGGMEHQTVCLGTIELIAHNRTTQTVGMGAMDTQLVRATRLRIEGDELRVEKLEIGYCPLTMLHIHHLSRAIHRVWAQGQ